MSSNFGQELLTSLTSQTNAAAQHGASMMRQAAKEAVKKVLEQKLGEGLINAGLMLNLREAIEIALDETHIEDPLRKGGGITGGAGGA